MKKGLSFSTENPNEEGYTKDVQDHIHFEILKEGKYVNPTPGEVITYEDPAEQFNILNSNASFKF